MGFVIWGEVTAAALRALWHSFCWHKWKPHYKWMPKRICSVWPGVIGWWPAGSVRVGKRCSKCGRAKEDRDWLDFLANASWLLSAALIFVLMLTGVVALLRLEGENMLRLVVWAWTGAA